MTEKLDVLQIFPHINALGKNRLQILCDDWTESPLAKEFAVSRMLITEKDGKLWLTFKCEITHQISKDDSYYFPMDEFLRYVADKGISDQAKRDSTKASILLCRQQGGPDVFRKFRINAGEKLPLFLTCPNRRCRNVMQSPFYAYRMEKIRFEPEQIECTRCKTKFVIDGSELHFEPGA